MSLVLSQRKSILQGIASLMIISGLHLKHTADEIGDQKTNQMPAELLFVIGFVLLAWSIGTRGDVSTIVPQKLSAAGVSVIAILAGMYFKNKETDPKEQKKWKLLFAAGWIGLGVSICYDKEYANMGFAAAGVLAALVSTLGFMPWARNIVQMVPDHPGYSILCVGFMLLWLANCFKALPVA